MQLAINRLELIKCSLNGIELELKKMNFVVI